MQESDRNLIKNKKEGLIESLSLNLSGKEFHYFCRISLFFMGLPIFFYLGLAGLLVCHLSCNSEVTASLSV